MAVQKIALVQIGLGVVGGEVIAQALANRARWREHFDLDLRIAAIAGRDGALVEFFAAGLPDDRVRAIVVGRRTGAGFGEAAGQPLVPLTAVLEQLHDADRVIVVDAAAGAETAPMLAAAIETGAFAALANKAPLALPLADPVSQALWSAARDGRLRYEATCGAGLPVISTLATLLATGDRVIEIQGALSGTLGAIFTSVGAGLPFSVAVRDAKDQGFTEPDPRDDLSGLDVARKALILARSLGRAVDLDEIAIENLVPPGLRAVSVPEYLERVSEGDVELAALAAKAAAEGKRLKYLARVSAEGPITVGVQAASLDTIAGSLRGPENIVVFRTERYDAHPMIVVGPGAGAAVTAAGILGDVLALAHGSFQGA